MRKFMKECRRTVSNTADESFTDLGVAAVVAVPLIAVALLVKVYRWLRG